MRHLTGVVWAQAWFKLERFPANSPQGTEAAAKIDRARCPLWVKSGRDALKFRCPLYPRKQTFVPAVLMSALAESGHFGWFIRLHRPQWRKRLMGSSAQGLWQP
jgi:hypothetical protein